MNFISAVNDLIKTHICHKNSNTMKLLIEASSYYLDVMFGTWLLLENPI